MSPPDPLDLAGLSPRQRIVLAVSVIVILGLAALLLVVSLRRPAVDAFAPSAAAPRPVGDSLVGPATYTVDASSPEGWRFFDFSRGSVVDDPGPRGWDLAFRRFHLVANGGGGFSGRGGIAPLEAVAFDSLRTAPAGGYVATTADGDTTNAATEDWYDYSFTSHLLRPRPVVYAVRTADGRYAKLELLSYYCPGARPGCVTFRYVYQGDGSRSLAPGSDGP